MPKRQKIQALPGFAEKVAFMCVGVHVFIHDCLLLSVTKFDLRLFIVTSHVGVSF